MPSKVLRITLPALIALLSACGTDSDSASIFSEDGSILDNKSVIQTDGAPTRIDSSCPAASTPPTYSSNDPLLPRQWYLNNTGQSAYNSSGGCGGIAGEDINLPESLWASSKGSGIRVAVLDSEMDTGHPELSPNLDTVNSIDFDGDQFIGDHATSVAGIIAAVQGNSAGGSGIAPEATLQAFNILNSDNTSTSWAKALGQTGTAAEQVDIFNQSFGYGSTDPDYWIDSPMAYDTTFDAFYQNGVQNLRGGKGALYFKSAGNFFAEYGACKTLNTNDYGLPCQNANMDPDNNIPYNLVVAAVNAKGKASSYSSSGSSVIFSAPGGEYGVNHPAIIAPDDLNNNTSVDGQDGYTHRFNGTSSAAPMASGVAALILEAAPQLGWRDVRHIMLTTADKIDSTIPAATLAINGNTLTTEPAWQTNGGGYHFHNWYGFGRINAQAAVTAAQSYGSNLPAQQSKSYASGTLDQAIPDASAAGSSYTFTLAGADQLTVESVQLELSISHSYLSDLQIELVSPSGMTSVLMTPLNGMSSEVSRQTLVLLSQGFYGENSAGDWRLNLYDINSGDSGTLHSATLKIYGH